MGNWKMEYAPYSWESGNTSRMAPKEKVDIFASSLPDNEEFYKVKSKNYSRLYESSEDIMGTVSYYRDFVKNDMGKEITLLPAMDRETSLDTLRRKLENFMLMKKNYGKQIQENIEKYLEKIKDSKLLSQESLDSVIAESEKIYNSTKDYAKLRDSMDELRIQIEIAKHEAATLRDAKTSDKLIDISRRDIFDPNKPLWDALQDKKNSLGKLVALPHKSISVEHLISDAGIKLTDPDFALKTIKYVDKLIEKRI